MAQATPGDVPTALGNLRKAAAAAASAGRAAAAAHYHPPTDAVPAAPGAAPTPGKAAP